MQVAGLQEAYEADDFGRHSSIADTIQFKRTTQLRRNTRPDAVAARPLPTTLRKLTPAARSDTCRGASRRTQVVSSLTNDLQPSREHVPALANTPEQLVRVRA